MKRYVNSIKQIIGIVLVAASGCLMCESWGLSIYLQTTNLVLFRIAIGIIGLIFLLLGCYLIIFTTTDEKNYQGQK